MHACSQGRAAGTGAVPKNASRRLCTREKVQESKPAVTGDTRRRMLLLLLLLLAPRLRLLSLRLRLPLLQLLPLPTINTTAAAAAAAAAVAVAVAAAAAAATPCLPPPSCTLGAHHAGPKQWPGRRGLINCNLHLHHRGLDKALIHLNKSVEMQNDVPGGEQVSVGAMSWAASLRLPRDLSGPSVVGVGEEVGCWVLRR